MRTKYLPVSFIKNRKSLVIQTFKNSKNANVYYRIEKLFCWGCSFNFIPPSRFASVDAKVMVQYPGEINNSL